MKLLPKLIAAAIATTLTAIAPQAAAQDTKIKFTLDWKIQGLHAWYYWAQDKGYFKAEKLDVTIDQGEGSAATVTRIMSGTYQAGFGDMNAIIQNAATKPGEAPVMVYMLYNRAPFALLTKADKLGRSEQAQTLTAVCGEISKWNTGFTASLFSSLKKTGTTEVEAVIAKWLAIEASASRAKVAAPGANALLVPLEPLRHPILDR